MHPTKLITAAAALAFAAAAAASPPGEPESGRRCTVSGFVAVQGPVHARVGPGPAFAVAGTIPDRDPDADLDRPASFDVIEARDGWFRIENGAPWSASGEPAAAVAGWLSGREVAFSLQTYLGFAEPDPSSAIRWRSRTMDEPRAIAALDCRGEWVKIRFSDGTELREAWFRGVCGNPDTSCDMPPGDSYRD
jgi:hypothetical protein